MKKYANKKYEIAMTSGSKMYSFTFDIYQLGKNIIGIREYHKRKWEDETRIINRVSRRIESEMGIYLLKVDNNNEIVDILNRESMIDHINKNKMIYLKMLPQAAPEVISHINKYITFIETKNLLEYNINYKNFTNFIFNEFFSDLRKENYDKKHYFYIGDILPNITYPFKLQIKKIDTKEGLNCIEFNGEFAEEFVSRTNLMIGLKGLKGIPRNQKYDFDATLRGTYYFKNDEFIGVDSYLTIIEDGDKYERMISMKKIGEPDPIQKEELEQLEQIINDSILDGIKHMGTIELLSKYLEGGRAYNFPEFRKYTNTLSKLDLDDEERKELFDQIKNVLNHLIHIDFRSYKFNYKIDLEKINALIDEIEEALIERKQHEVIELYPKELIEQVEREILEENK